MKYFSLIFLGMLLFTLYLTGCGVHPTTEPTIQVIPNNTPIPLSTLTNIPRPTNTLEVIKTSTPTYQRYYRTPTPSQTLSSTDRARNATSEAYYIAQGTSRAVASHIKETQVAQFPPACEGEKTQNGDISPDGKWIASNCDDKTSQTLVVQNKDGIKWVLEFKDFLSPDTPELMPGSLFPMFWSPEGKYLYFSSGLGYSGGGTECFNGGTGYGLFRLDLETGEWTTLIAPTGNFPGYLIRFSPTGRRYALRNFGIRITDLQTGEDTQIDAPGIYDFSWSPDGRYLAYTVATCGEWEVETSSAYIWDVLTNQSQKLLTTEKILLQPESWIDNSTFRILGYKLVDQHDYYTTYDYNIDKASFILTATTTPHP